MHVHRLLVEALGEPGALRELGGELWLPADAWRRAVERVRTSKHATLPDDEAWRAIGVDLGRAFLSSEVGKLVSETLPLLSFERAFGHLLPMLSERMRGRFDTEWTNDGRGGRLRVAGPIVLSPEVTAGMLEHVASLVDRSAKVRVASASDGEMVFEVAPGP